MKRKIVNLSIKLWLLFSILSTASNDDFQHLREHMVMEQIVARGIKNEAVLKALRQVPRHLFVPDELKDLAYTDRPLPIGYGQTISQPYIVALMTELINPHPPDRVLEIGTGSGYQAAILAQLVKDVYTVEIIRPLWQRAEEQFRRLNYQNITTRWDDGYYGWEEHAPYDAIVVTCAVEFVPPPLLKQLKKGGRMVVPVGPPFYTQELLLIQKNMEGRISTEVIEKVLFVSLSREKR